MEFTSISLMVIGILIYFVFDMVFKVLFWKCAVHKEIIRIYRKRIILHKFKVVSIQFFLMLQLKLDYVCVIDLIEEKIQIGNLPIVVTWVYLNCENNHGTHG